MLAQTCSRIGSDTQPANSSVGTSSTGADDTETIVSIAAPPEAATTTSVESTQQLVAAAGLSSAVIMSNTITEAINTNAQSSQTFTINQEGNGMSVLSNVTLLPHMQSINIGGQEALFIPAQNSSDTTANPIQLGSQTTRPVQFSGQSALPIQPLSQNNPIVVQSNGQTVQQVPSFIQIPVSTASGQTIYQTIQIGTVPIPVNTNPVSIVQTSSSQSEGIIAAALADSQVQLKPTKKPQPKQKVIHEMTTTTTDLSGGDISLPTSVDPSQIIHTSNGYMLIPSSVNASGDQVSVNKSTSSPTKINVTAEYTTLDAVSHMEQPPATHHQSTNSQVSE